MKKDFALYILVLVFGFSFAACAQKSNTNELSASGDTSLMHKPDSFWKRKLSDAQYYILREKGTEKPYTGKWLLHKDSGIYSCSACGNHLFDSDSKFDSHCGWPSFDEEIKGGKIRTQTDLSHGMERTEIICGRCGGHLGHLFDDGPTSTGKRYCVNSVSLEFVPSKSLQNQRDTLTLGGGCFWCMEAVFDALKGVVSVESGYAGGSVVNPSYEAVCSGNTGHAEVVQIQFDPNITSLEEILKVFFTLHDPTTADRQGADYGSQYRSIILYRNPAQKAVAESIIAELNAAKVYSSAIVTQVNAFTAFYKAEISHQDYYKNNPDKAYCQMVIQPKLEKFEKVFKDRMK